MLLTNIYKEAYVEFLSQEVKGFNGQSRPRFYGYEHFTKFKTNDAESMLNASFGRKIFLISDHHFNHKNIIKFSKRPFVNIYDMETQLIDNHNSVVGKEDIVIFVGDFAFCNVTMGKQILDKMNGYKILVVGNHDIYHGKLKNFGYDEIYSSLTFLYNEVVSFISHYPVDFLPDGVLNIHGHEHIGYSEYITSIDHFNANCEYNNFKPLNLELILILYKMRKGYD